MLVAVTKQAAQAPCLAVMGSQVRVGTRLLACRQPAVVAACMPKAHRMQVRGCSAVHARLPMLAAARDGPCTWQCFDLTLHGDHPATGEHVHTIQGVVAACLGTLRAAVCPRSLDMKPGAAWAQSLVQLHSE